jgi:hypothetical protein
MSSNHQDRQPFKERLLITLDKLYGLDIKLSFKEIHIHVEFMPLAAFWGLLALLASVLVAIVSACLF